MAANVAAHLRQRRGIRREALVREDRDAERGDTGSCALRDRERRIECCCGVGEAEGHERAHVERTQPRVHSGVDSDVDEVETTCSESDRTGADLGSVPCRRQHRTVVVDVGVHVEKVGTGCDHGAAHRIEGMGITGRDVGDALDHLRPSCSHAGYIHSGAA